MAKRILIYTNHFFPENFKVNEIAEIFSEEGNTVHVITQTPNYPTGRFFKGYGLFTKSREQINANLRVRRLPVIPRGNGSKLELAFNYLSYFFSSFLYTTYLAFFHKKFDIVFVHHTSPVLITLNPIWYRKVRKSKLILWDLDMWPDTLVAIGIIKSKSLVNFLENRMRWIYNQYDQILLGSKGFFKKASSRVELSKIDYFPNWAENVFTNQKNDSNEVEIEYPSSFNLVYAGNLGEAQDFESVFKAILLLKGYSISWIFIGDGRFKSKLMEMTRMSNLMDKVKFLGNHPLEKMPNFFKKSDAMFLSLKNEDIFKLTVPAKLQAYMASGKPIVAMLSGEGSELIKESSCGFVAESGDYNGFAKIVLDLFFMSQQDRNQLGQNGKNFYFTNFEISKRKNQLRKVVNS